MAKNKRRGGKGRPEKERDHLRAEPGARVPGRPAEVPDTNERPTRESLRESVGRGTLAEHALDSIAAAMTELERIYGEVAALGKSLALARDQLAEQESELEATRESLSPGSGLERGPSERR